MVKHSTSSSYSTQMPAGEGIPLLMPDSQFRQLPKIRKLDLTNDDEQMICRLDVLNCWNALSMTIHTATNALSCPWKYFKTDIKHIKIPFVVWSFLSKTLIFPPKHQIYHEFVELVSSQLNWPNFKVEMSHYKSEKT